MALQREIWLTSIQEGLFADNSFLSRSVDHSDFVNYRTVHVPNAGAAPGVEKDRTVYPAQVSTRTDIDLEYQLHEYTTDPIRIPHADQVELSYSKRESVIGASRGALHDKISNDILTAWTPTSQEHKVKTKGAKITQKDAFALQLALSQDKVPLEGRVLLLSAEAYSDLIQSLTDAQSNAFLACADASKGIVGHIAGFEVMQRATLPGGILGLAWQRTMVSRALGETELFEEEKTPTYYGDVVGFLVRAGGSLLRHDGLGVRALIAGEATPTGK